MAVVSSVISDITPKLTVLKQLRPTGWSEKDRTDITREIDLEALAIYEAQLVEELSGTKAMICSEENPAGKPLSDVQSFPELLFIIDPVDNTDGGVHGSPAYTAISVYDRLAQTVVAAAVGDLYRREVYYADEEVGALWFAAPVQFDQSNRLTPNAQARLPGAYVSMYSLKPSRLRHSANHERLLESLGEHGRVDNVGGAASLCKVAAGYFDAAVETAKGFQVYDLFPGAFILMKAGGICIRPDTGQPVSLSLAIHNREHISSQLKTRQPFVAAANSSLAFEILAALNARSQQ